MAGLEQYTTEQLIEEAERRLTGKNGATEKITLVCMDNVEEEETQWLYYPYIPRSKITLCAAYPGAGKTYVICYVAACVSAGKQFFDIPCEAKPEKVIYITSEDGLGDTIKKRLRECGANMINVFSVKDPAATATFDNPEIKQLVDKVRPALLVFDPFQSFIGENVELNAANKTRAKLNSIARVAEEYNTAVILICHFNKNVKGESITRVIGSTDIVGLSRSYLAIGNVPKEPGMKYMSHEKSSLAKRGDTKIFHIDSDNGGIVYDGDSSLTMDDYTALSYSKGKSCDQLVAAERFLMENMLEGKRLASELKALAKLNGISERTLDRARLKHGIVSKRETFKGPYYWIKPSASSNTD